MSKPEPSWHGADPNAPDFRSTLHERYRHLRNVAPVSLTPVGLWRLTKHADVVRLLAATRDDPALALGASPRAGVMVLQAAKSHAALAARDFITPDDLKSVCLPALRHRVILDPAEELAGTTPDEAIERILETVEVPR